jgi:hypothetical protein
MLEGRVNELRPGLLIMTRWDGEVILVRQSQLHHMQVVAACRSGRGIDLDSPGYERSMCHSKRLYADRNAYAAKGTVE